MNHGQFFPGIPVTWMGAAGAGVTEISSPALWVESLTLYACVLDLSEPSQGLGSMDLPDNLLSCEMSKILGLYLLY